GEAEVDVQPYRPWRFGGPYRDTGFAAAAAREVYKYYYRLRYPLDVSEAGRPKRLSPLHERLEALGAVFGTKNGWERADYFCPGEPARRAGEDQRAVGWARPPWYDRVAVEHAAIRERLGIIDMTSFGKLETSDLDVLERVCDARIDRPVGSVVYTQLVDERGHIVGDVTVTRLAEDRFRIVTGAGAVDSDRGFLELHGARVDDVTDDYAVIGIWGPEARSALAEITERDVSNEAFPFRTARELEFGLAQRITYVGELGYELYVPRAGAVAVWDALLASASPEPVGYQALDSLRIEKGYRYFGTDMTASDTPFEAGVGFCVAKGKFAQLERSPERRLRTLVVGGEEYETIYGGEAVHAGGEVIGRVRSAAYGFTVRRNVALAMLPAGLAEGARVEVDVLGELVPALGGEARPERDERRARHGVERTPHARTPEHVADPRDDTGVAGEPHERHRAEEQPERGERPERPSRELRQEAREEERHLRIAEVAEEPAPVGAPGHDGGRPSARRRGAAD